MANAFAELAIEANQANPAILGEWRKAHPPVVDMGWGRASGRGGASFVVAGACPGDPRRSDHRVKPGGDEVEELRFS